MTKEDARSEYQDGQVVLVTEPAVPIPAEVLNDTTPPFDAAPLARAA